MPEQPSAESDYPWTFEKVLWRERAYINLRRRRLDLPRIDSLSSSTALCLSGGGVRSASFCLGVVRALARYNVLKNFDYLSTVSGGGFTGGFLSRWAREDGYTDVERRLKDDLEFADPRSPLAHVRNYISYLTPRIGLFSLDSIAGAGLFIRNLLLNWLIILPIIMAGLAVVLLGQEFFQRLGQLEAKSALYFLSILMLTGVTLCGYAISYALFRRPGLSALADDPPFDKLQVNYSWPVFIGSLLVSAGIVTAKSSTKDSDALSLAIALLCILILALMQIVSVSAEGGKKTMIEMASNVMKTLLPLAAQCLAFILFGIAILNGISRQFSDTQWASDYGPSLPIYNLEALANVYYVFGPLVFTVTLYLSEIIYVAARRNPIAANYEREWLARSTGALFGMPLAWAFLSFSVIYGPEIVNSLIVLLPGKEEAPAIRDALGVTTISGLVVALLSRRKDAVALVKQGYETWMQFGTRWLLAIALPLFAFMLVVLLTFSVQKIAVSRFELLPPVWTYSLLGAALALFGILFDLLIPTNVFTLHSIYRNRLIRSFVGAANPDRTRKNRAIGFLNYFSTDNLSLFELIQRPTRDGQDPSHLPPMADYVPPQMHLLNMALNVPGSADIALQERKALPFSASAAAVGSRALFHPDPQSTSKPPEERQGSYRPARLYASANNLAFSLGSAIAISGAAVSPNMGYHSSAALGPLLTLFNLRLGGWFGNPKLPGDKSYTKDGPELNITTLFNEAVGRANEKRKFVHLSDGGHFDNLGLYEMLARRCRLIVVVDAGCDPNTGLDDFGVVQRLAKLDLGAEVTFPDGAMSDVRASKARLAIGDIRYAATSKQPESEGVLVYVKPRMLANDPAIISSYSTRNPQFPHEPTADQWFTESQFAAYMALGELAGAAIPAHTLSVLRPPKPQDRNRRKGVRS